MKNVPGSLERLFLKLREHHQQSKQKWKRLVHEQKCQNQTISLWELKLKVRFLANLHHGFYSHDLLFVLQMQNARLIGPLDYLQSIMWLSIDIIFTFNGNLVGMEWAIDYRTSLQLQTPRWIQIRWIIRDRLVPDINVIFEGVAIPNYSINMRITCKHSYNSCWLMLDRWQTDSCIMYMTINSSLWQIFWVLIWDVSTCFDTCLLLTNHIALWSVKKSQLLPISRYVY